MSTLFISLDNDASKGKKLALSFRNDTNDFPWKKLSKKWNILPQIPTWYLVKCLAYYSTQELLLNKQTEDVERDYSLNSRWRRLMEEFSRIRLLKEAH